MGEILKKSKDRVKKYGEVYTPMHDEAFKKFLTLCASKNRKKNLAAGMIARDISRASQVKRNQ